MPGIMQALGCIGFVHEAIEKVAHGDQAQDDESEKDARLNVSHLQ
jgi:hypothetical protein